MNRSKIFLALFIMVSALLFGSLIWRNSPEAFSNHVSDLPTDEKVISSSSLGFPSPSLEEGDVPPSFPPDLISIEQAITSIKQRYPGRVIRAELLINERGPVYEIDVERSDGMITVIEVDAQTGQVLEPHSNLLQAINPLFLSDKNKI